jgi:selenocysteine lyase/cysteine desulfurase
MLQRKYAYINCAYMSPMLKKVENAGKAGLKMKRKPYKISGDDFFHDTETLRSLFSQLIKADAPERCVIIPSVSYGMANVVNNLPKKGRIIVVEGQFPSNVYPWMGLEAQGYEVHIVEAPKTIQKGKEWNERILSAINKDTVLLAIGHVHWADGTLFDLQAFRKRLDEVDGLLVIDGTQSVGALPFDCQAIQPDALIVAGYKWLLGPYSIGMAYYGPRFDQGSPIEQNWINRVNSDNFAGLVNYQSEYREGALRYEVGEHSNFILVPMLRAAITQLLAWKPEVIQNYCASLFDEVVPITQEMGYGVEDTAYRSKHLFGLQLPNGVDGTEAMNIFKQRKVSVSLRGNAIRLSPHVYNDETDVRKLLAALAQIVGKTD